MRLLRLALENWRGVSLQKIEFDAGVTLIEGPNEIGKSTLVEALRTLFEELDSSSKKSVKAIQPIGQDVGSQVEVEIITGDYHFVYTKTYNKNKQIELRMLAPTTEQLTGREAHEKAEQILQATIDMGLWNALLLEQGKEVSGVHLADSDGLARALDEAAGSSSTEEDDSGLFAAVQAEYELYFTLKTGKPKFAALETTLLEAQTKKDEARKALSAIEDDSVDHERCVAEVRRLETALPELEKNAQKHDEHWRDISDLQQNVTKKQAELASARELLQAASDEQARRLNLAEELATSGQTLLEKREQLTPLAEQAKKLQEDSDKVSKLLKARKKALKQARDAVDLAKADEEHLKAIAELTDQTQRLTRLGDYQKNAAAEREKLSGIQIDASGLDRLRQAENDLQVAIGKRDAVTSAVEVSAEQDLEITFNEEQLTLASGTVEKRHVADELRIGIPGVASIQIIPSHSAAELETEVLDHEATVKGLLKKHAVTSLADAVATEARRVEAARDLKTWNDKITELLDDDTEEDIRARMTQLQSRCDDYAEKRPDEPALPTELEQASALTASAETALKNAEEAVDTQQLESERLREEHSAADANCRVATQEVEGLDQDRQRKETQLADARTSEPDDAITARAEDKAKIAKELQSEFDELSSRLDSASPEAAQELLENANASYQRAQRELQERQRERAVLEDRLTQAQANGRFEALEDAERAFEELQNRYDTTTTRAAAVERLWQTLNKHRDATRKAYVRPLKDGIEQLGKIVFGADFTVELDDAWSLVSCTRDGLTVPFDDLSVGAREQLGILTRLAAARIVSNQGGVPLIIDDALGFSDPGRLETMGAAIAATGKDSQIILLTCTPGRFTHVGNAEVIRWAASI